MQLVEQHVIALDDPRYPLIDEAAFQSKNLYNAALYTVRQAFIHVGTYLNYRRMDKLMQKHEAYQALPRKVSQWVLKGLHHNWLSFFESLKAYKEDPSKFTGRPKLPKYKHKTDGRNMLVYTIQAISKPELEQGIIKPSQLAITVKTKQQCIKQVRIVPNNGFYVVEVVYERVTRHMECITNKRNRQIDHYLHTASRRIIDFLVEEGVGTVIIGLNPLWKQEAKLGRRTNQNLVSIPHSRFIDMLTYKATLVGIQVEAREECYTSKASFLDLDPIPDYQPDVQEVHHFSGKRIGPRSRLYRAKNGRTISADVNGAYNIVRKSRPNAFAEGIAGYVVHPIRLVV